MTHRFNLALLAILLASGVPFFWLHLENPPRAVAPFKVTVAQLRALAATVPGPRPVRIELTQVGEKPVPGNLYAAGSGIRMRRFAVLSFRFPVPGASPVIVDTGTTRDLAVANKLSHFDPQRQAAVERDMREASIILATGADPLSLGGLAGLGATPNSAPALSRSRLNVAQVPGDTGPAALPWPPSLVLRPAIDLSGPPQAVAPGIVVIPAGSVLPGAQLIYVRLASGREYILAGDVVPLRVSLDELRARSNQLEWNEPGTSRTEQMRWLVTLKRMESAVPGLLVIPGHDRDWITDRDARTGIEIPER